MALALPAHLPGILLAPGAKLTGRMRNVDTGTGAFSLYLRFRTGNSGTLFLNSPLQVVASGASISVGGLTASGSPGTIQHLVFVRFGNGASRLYLDNNLVASGTYAAAIGSPDYEVGPYSGRIYRCCFWNRALSADDVVALPTHGPADFDRWGSGSPPPEPPPDPPEITLTADPDTVEPDGTSTLTAVVTNSVSGVTWSIISGPGALSGTTAYGATYTAPSDNDAAIVVIRATSIEDPSVTTDIAISITPLPATITGVNIGATPTTILLSGGTSLVSAFVIGTGPFDPGLTWSITGGTGAGTLTFDTANSRILDGTSGGTVVVRATSTGDPTKFNEVTVTVSAFSGLRISLFAEDLVATTGMELWVDRETGTDGQANDIEWHWDDDSPYFRPVLVGDHLSGDVNGYPGSGYGTLGYINNPAITPVGALEFEANMRCGLTAMQPDGPSVAATSPFNVTLNGGAGFANGAEIYIHVTGDAAAETWIPSLEVVYFGGGYSVFDSGTTLPLGTIARIGFRIDIPGPGAYNLYLVVDGVDTDFVTIPIPLGQVTDVRLFSNSGFANNTFDFYDFQLETF